MLRIEDFGLWRPGAGVVFEGVNTWANPGEVTLVAGPNGAGASTFLSAVAGQLGPGQRRSGEVHLAGTRLTAVAPDELSRIVGQVVLPPPGGEERVVDVLAAVSGSSGSSFGSVELNSMLGLDEFAELRLGELNPSERMRLRLATECLQDRPVVLLDQVLAPVESRWRFGIRELTRMLANRGVVVLWAEQSIDDALVVADRVIEIRREDRSPVDAFDWRPVSMGLSPLQLHASLARVERPREPSLPAWREVLVGTALAAPQDPVSNRGTRMKISLTADKEIVVDEDAPPVILCDSARAVGEAVVHISKSNRTEPFEPDAFRPVKRLAGGIDRRTGRSRGTTLTELARAVRGLRPDAGIDEHSSGERAALLANLAMRISEASVLVDPFACLDTDAARVLREAVHRDWLESRRTLVVTTDVEAAVQFDRVVVWSHGAGIIADGSPEAIGDHLPARPVLSQLLLDSGVVRPVSLAQVMAGGRK